MSLINNDKCSEVLCEICSSKQLKPEIIDNRIEMTCLICGNKHD